MSDISTEQITEAVKVALAEDRKNFYVPPETHYNDHQFIGKLSRFFDKTTGTIVGTAVRVVVVGIIGLLAIGFFVYTGKNILAVLPKTGG